MLLFLMLLKRHSSISALKHYYTVHTIYIYWYKVNQELRLPRSIINNKIQLTCNVHRTALIHYAKLK